MPDTYLQLSSIIYNGALQPLSLLRIWVGIKSKAHYQPGYHSNSNGFYKGICFHWLQANTKQVFKKPGFVSKKPGFFGSFPRRIVATLGLPDYLKGKEGFPIFFQDAVGVGACRNHRPSDHCQGSPGPEDLDLSDACAMSGVDPWMEHCSDQRGDGRRWSVSASRWGGAAWELRIPWQAMRWEFLKQSLCKKGPHIRRQYDNI